MEENTLIAPETEAPGNPMDIPPAAFRAGLERRGENRKLMMEWIRAALVEGSDYGKIHVVGKNKCDKGKWCKNPHHFSKPSLFKPGAEKICGLLGLKVAFPSLKDYERSAIDGREIQTIILRCELIDGNGNVVGTGIGGRSVKQDFGDINKALKMTEKSAHVDAVLRTAGLSEVFTQDVEDMEKFSAGNAPPPPQTERKDPPPRPQPRPQPKPEPAPVETRPQDIPPGETISEPQRVRLEAQINELRLDRERVKELASKWFGKYHFAELGIHQYAYLHRFLPRIAAKAEAERKNPTLRLDAIQTGLETYLKDFDEPPEGNAEAIVTKAWSAAGERHGEWPTEDFVDHGTFFKIVLDEINGRVPCACRDCDALNPSIWAAIADGWKRDSPRQPGPVAFVCPDCQKSGKAEAGS